MKKILFTVLFFLGLVILAGCQEGKSEFEVEVVDINGNVLLSKTISYEDGSNQNIVDLIDETIGLDYDVYDFGIYIKGVADFYPTEYNVTYNYYFSLYVDDVFSEQGIDSIVLTDEMKVSFIEVSMLDEVDLQVDQLIQLFIENHLETYINDEQIHYYVALAIAQLNVKNYDVPQLNTLVENVNGINRGTITDALKTAVLETLFDLSIEESKLALEGFEAGNNYGAISLLTGLYITNSESDLVHDLIHQLTTSTSPYMDGDYAGMVLSALAPYSEDEDVLLFVNSMLEYIQENQTSEGIEGWGGPNSASTASVILGLVAQGNHPRDALYTVGGIDLIEALLEFEIDGAYKSNLSSEEANLDFSTPQAFAALVAYKLYRDTYLNPSVNLFNIR